MVDLAKSGGERLPDRFHGDPRDQFHEVHHAGPHRGNAFGLQFPGGNMQVVGHLFRIHIDQNGPMVIAPAAAGIEGVSGELAAARCQVVAAGFFRLNPQRLHRPEDYVQLAWYAVILLVDQKGKIEVAQVVEYRAPSGKAAGQKAPVAFQGFHAAFPAAVLVAANHDRVLVLPKVEDTFPREDSV